jgi:hypothetical protein
MKAPTGLDLVRMQFTDAPGPCKCGVSPAPVLIKQVSYCYRCALELTTSALCVLALQTSYKPSSLS